jgi:chromate transporter
MTSPPDRHSQTRAVVPFRTATRAWFDISLRTFGGPAGQIAVMHRELVDERRWIGEQRFLRALSYCTLLPGPEAQQLAIYLGWLLNGTLGGLVAGVLFVVPGYVSLMALSAIYAAWGATTTITAIFAGLAPAVLAIVTQAVARISSRALGNRLLIGIAVATFVALFAFNLPFPVVIGAAALVGYLAGRIRPGIMAPEPRHAPSDARAPLIADDALHGERPSLRRAIRILAIGLTLWATPVAIAAIVLGRSHVFVHQGLFFAGTAVVTFGGAYAVLTYIAQRAVYVYHWLLPGEMVNGLALAETTPGPLIMVVQFVGFLGAYRSPGSLPPWLAGTLAALLTTWVTYVPCFLWIFAGAPYVERLRENRWLRGALTGITAAVVGVILNLTIWFSLHTLFALVQPRSHGPFTLELPVWTSLDPAAAAIAAGALVATFAFHARMLPLLAGCAAAGLGWRLLAA